MKGKYYIIIDPGHVAETPGREHNGFREYEFNWDVARKLEDLLRKDKIPYVFSLPVPSVVDGQSWVKERSARRRNWKLAEKRFKGMTPILFSLHANASKEPNTGHGVEVWYNETPRSANILCDMLADGLDLRNRGPKSNDGRYFVLNYWDKRIGWAYLIEYAFFDHDGDRSKLVLDEFRYLCARITKSFIQIIIA